MSDARRAGATAVDSAGQKAIAFVLRAALRVTVKRAFQAGLPIDQQRRRLLAATRLTLPPRRVSFETASSGGVPGEVVCERNRGTASPVILYLHGGGYTTGSPRTHRALTGHLAVSCRARVFVAEYRLAPEHPFPAGLDDAVAAYCGLLDDGIEPGDVAIAGDSAGGGLAVAAALKLRELGQPLPSALVLFSPLADLTREYHDAPPRGEVMLTPAWLRECARSYVATGDPGDPLVSPVEADLHGLPPTLIQVGTDELLRQDSRRLFERLQSAGVRAELREFPGRWHVFQASAGVLADADRALEEAARFIRGAPR
jgi:monoterpene epsilon-lactone hydrolase